MPSLMKPNGQLYICKDVDLNDYSTQYDWFQTKEEQLAFFISKSIGPPMNDVQFIRETGSIRVRGYVDDYRKCDYCFFKNYPNKGNAKWIYCFITSVTYVNDLVTQLNVEIDAYQTYFFEIQFDSCFIAQAHSKEFKNNIISPDNALFDNLITEGLEYGDVYRTVAVDNTFYTTFYILISSTAKLDADFGDLNNPTLSSSSGCVLNNCPSATTYYACGLTEFKGLMARLNNYPWITQCFQSLTVIPDKFYTRLVKNPVNVKGVTIQEISGYAALTTNKITSNCLSKFPNYNHDKLYTYPYSFIELTANNGEVFIIKPQLLSSKELKIYEYYYVGDKPRMSFVVGDYAGLTSYDNGITLNNFPQFPILTDNYLMYQAQNARSFTLERNIAEYNKQESVFFGTLEGGVGAISSLLDLNLGGAVSSLYNAGKSIYESQKNNEIAIRKQMAKISDAQVVAPSIGGLVGGDGFNIQNNRFGYQLKWKTILPQYQSILNRYFYRYGYKQNKIDIVSLYRHKNQYYNYIQTQNCRVKGDIPVEYRRIIEGMFDNGTTLLNDPNQTNYLSPINPRIG